MNGRIKLTIIDKVRIVTPRSIIERGHVAMAEGRILAVGPGDAQLDPLSEITGPNTETEFISGDGLTAMPGFMDIHMHGGGGSDTMNADTSALMNICRTHAAGGTTRLLATTMSAPPSEVRNALSAIGEAVRVPSEQWPGSRVMGAHVEGPFISHKYKGAQPGDNIRSIDPEEIDRMIGASGNTVRMMTFAPELSGALKTAAYLRAKGIVPVIGHTGAGYDETMAAIGIGMTNVTHVMNGMSGLHHREPGVLGAVLSSDETTVQLIADGIHIHPAVIRIIIKCKGPHAVALITDSMEAVGLPDGDYKLGSHHVKVKAGLCTLADGTIAGSTLTMNRAVRNAIVHGGASLKEAAIMSSLVPARILGLESSMGSLEPGKLADLVLLDSEFNVLRTIIDGRTVYEAPRIQPFAL